MPKTFWKLSQSDRLLLVESMFWLALAWIAIAALPFRYVGRLASRATHQQVPGPQVRVAIVKRVRWAIYACARRVPWRAKCFEQGLAAQFMLRRRGVPSIVYYGAAPDNLRGLSAHVWVRDGDVDVIGCEIASRYAVLAMFPSQDGPSRDKKWSPV
jgi:hypothetical protein